MLNITASMSSDATKSYFAKSDYRSEGQELIGEWRGHAAEELGLRGIIDKQSFDRLCDNLNPNTGDQLTGVTRDGRRADMTSSGQLLNWSRRSTP